MSETLSLAFAFTWLFAVPAQPPEVAPDALPRQTVSPDSLRSCREKTDEFRTQRELVQVQRL
ncbi:MAG TPA: hypothetical protein VGF58_04265 [Burkholderiales bacterium]|jgi:hypothetical protein